MSLFRRYVATTLLAAIAILLLILFSLKTRMTEETKQSKTINNEANIEVSPLLTLFTTVKEIGMIPHHQLAFNAVLTNWPSFKPYVRPVIFLNYTNSTLARQALDAGWDVLPLMRTNSKGTPFLKDMYRTIFEKYKSMLYGFANGDILFDDGLLKMLAAVERKMSALNNNVLLVGRRTNIDVNAKNTLVEEFQKDRLQALAAAKGELFRVDALDYFLISNEGSALNWSNMVDVVIGRPAYDNYFVAKAIADGVNVIEATNALLAVHMSEKNVMSHGLFNHDARYNKEIIGNFVYENGFTTHLSWELRLDFSGEVFIVKRHK